MLEDFQAIDVFRPSIFDISGNMFVALICGLIIALVYRMVYKGPNYSATFVVSLVLLTLITSVVILVIGNNLARAFGLVGAMSIIRFRTAVRDVQDIVFIFFALTVGMGAGVGLASVAVIATVIICSVILTLNAVAFAQPKRKQHLLQITYHGDDAAETTLAQLLKEFSKKTRLVNLRQAGAQGVIDAFYHLHLRRNKQEADLLRELRATGFVDNVNIYFDEDDANAPTAI